MLPWLMANLGESFSPDVHCVFVETNLNTRLAVLAHKDDTISHLKENICKEHNQCFPEVGEIKMTAVKVERQSYLYHISDSMIVSKVFEGIRSNCNAYVDVVRVEKGELFSIKAEKTTKKKSRDGKKCFKKDSVDINGPVVNSESCALLSPREKLGDDVLTGAICEDNESAEKNGINVQEIQKISDEEMLNHENSITTNDLMEAVEQDLGKGDKAAELVKMDQEKDLAPTLEPADGHVTSTDAVNEKLHELLSGPIEKDNEGGEGSKLAPSSGAYLQIAELGASSGLAAGPTEENKMKRKRSSKASKSSKSRKTKAIMTGSQSPPTGPAPENKKKRKKSAKDSKMTASQSHPDISNNESPAVDGVPNCQAN